MTDREQRGSQCPLQKCPNFILLGPYFLSFCCLPTSPQAEDETFSKVWRHFRSHIRHGRWKTCHNLKTFREPRSELHMELTGSKGEMLPKTLTVTHSICHDCIFVSCEENKHRPERQGWSQYLIPPWLEHLHPPNSGLKWERIKLERASKGNGSLRGGSKANIQGSKTAWWEASLVSYLEAEGIKRHRMDSLKLLRELERGLSS